MCNQLVTCVYYFSTGNLCHCESIKIYWFIIVRIAYCWIVPKLSKRKNGVNWKKITVLYFDNKGTCTDCCEEKGGQGEQLTFKRTLIWKLLLAN